MNKYISSIIFFFVLLSWPLHGHVVVDDRQLDKKIMVRLSALQKDYLIGEPISIKVEVINISSELVKVGYLLDSTYAFMNYYWINGNEKERTGKMHADAPYDSMTLSPNKSISNCESLPPKTQAGDYELQARNELRTGGVADILSNIIEINVVGPKGIDTEAYKLFVGTDSNRFSDIIIKYPDSRYSKYAEDKLFSAELDLFWYKCYDGGNRVFKSTGTVIDEYQMLMGKYPNKRTFLNISLARFLLENSDYGGYKEVAAGLEKGIPSNETDLESFISLKITEVDNALRKLEDEDAKRILDDVCAKYGKEHPQIEFYYEVLKDREQRKK